MTGRRPLSLRARLLLSVLGLLVLVFAVVGVVTQAVLRDYLVHRLDQQVSAASMRSLNGVGGYGPGRPYGGQPDADLGTQLGRGDSPPACQALGQAAGTICTTVSSDGTVSLPSLLGSEGQNTSLSAKAAEQLAAVPVDGHAHTVSVSGAGSYRVMATTQGPDGATVISGLPLKDVDDTVTRFAVVGGSVAGGGIVLAFVLGALMIGHTLRPLRRVAATAGRVAELQLDRGEVALSERVGAQDTDPRTEVGAVGNAMNRMLDRVDSALSARQASETRVRQFVADASHELRTPLAAIRGYAELTRRGREPVPPDVAHALDRVESEATRMTGLVEDLLLLARLDSAGDGAPALAVDDVDLSTVVIDCVSDAHAAGPEHRWSLDLPDIAVHVAGDGPRLHQVVANLLANARTHTPAGTQVTVGVAEQAGAVVLTVTDDGPGIPEALVPQLFERFSRGDSSRSRAAGSTGLGLSIVAAVVAAHRGTVGVTSEPGHTVFSVRLPALR